MNTTRLIFSPAALSSDQARVMVRLICRENKITTFQRTRTRLKNRFQKELIRVIKFAKHETLRKLHRYMHTHRAIMGQDEPPDHPDSSRIAFNADELRQDLQTLLAREIPITLSISANDTTASVGGAPFQLVAQDVLDFVARRENLLSGISDEIFNTIRSEISTGLLAGESIADLSARITAAFSEIEAGRAEVIAETETAAAYSFASNKAAQAAGIGFKRWLHGASKVPRPDHLGINGLVVPFDEPFPVGNPPLMYPHDENGSPEDVINCSCIALAATQEEFQAQ